MLKRTALIVILLVTMRAAGQTAFSFDSILNKSDILKKVSSEHKKYHLQIIYTQITRKKDGIPSFKTYTFKEAEDYFYCASLVKLPCSILALEKLNALSPYKIDRNTIMFTDSANACQRTVKSDPAEANGYPSIAGYIKKMALVSDNFAYGRIYEFDGVDYVHERLSELGFKNIRIIQRFDGGCKGLENVTTNPVSFYDKDLKLLYRQPQAVAAREYTHPLGTAKTGTAYINAQSKKINEPKDFTHMNYMSLFDAHFLLQRLIFPESVKESQRYKLNEDDRQFLITYLTLYPRESDYPHYDEKKYYDSYKKYLIYGDTKARITNEDLKITNIVGQSYGFLADCAYIRNKKENVEFMLSAVIYTNEDEVINDGKYEYATIGFPFLAELGRQFYAYQLRRK